MLVINEVADGVPAHQQVGEDDGSADQPGRGAGWTYLDPGEQILDHNRPLLIAEGFKVGL